MNPLTRLHGLIAATFTPFHPDGSLNPDGIEPMASHLLAQGVTTAFVNGTTGECASLTVEERLVLARRWLEVARGTPLRIVVHTGTNCLADSRALTADAARNGAAAVAAFAPSYFKPGSVASLTAWAGEIASAAPDLPFYFYDIPSLTGVSFPMPAFLEDAGRRIPNLAGLKFTNSDLAAYQCCIRAEDGRWDVPFGIDEHLLGALAMGARGAVGSGYNFAAPVYQRLLDAFERGDLEAAREEQFRGVRLARVLAGTGYPGAAKATLAMIGVDAGPARPPHPNPDANQLATLRSTLESLGFFDWIR